VIIDFTTYTEYALLLHTHNAKLPAGRELNSLGGNPVFAVSERVKEVEPWKYQTVVFMNESENGGRCNTVEYCGAFRWSIEVLCGTLGVMAVEVHVPAAFFITWGVSPHRDVD